MPNNHFELVYTRNIAGRVLCVRAAQTIVCARSKNKDHLSGFFFSVALMACIQRTLHRSRMGLVCMFFFLMLFRTQSDSLIRMVFFYFISSSSSSLVNRGWFYLTWLLIADSPLTVLFAQYHIEKGRKWMKNRCLFCNLVILPHKIISHDSRSFETNQFSTIKKISHFFLFG